MQTKVGLYVGTEVEGRWWRRYTGGASLRGATAACGRTGGPSRYLTADALHSTWSLVHSIQSGAFHSGRWAWGLPIIKVHWKANDESLSFGFMVAGNRTAQLEALDTLRREHTARAAATR